MELLNGQAISPRRQEVAATMSKLLDYPGLFDLERFIMSDGISPSLTPLMVDLRADRSQ
jgi:hypothetical protein